MALIMWLFAGLKRIAKEKGQSTIEKRLNAKEKRLNVKINVIQC